MANNATIDDEISLRISRASASFGRVKDRVWCRDYISIMHRVFKMLYIYLRAAVSVAARCYACLSYPHSLCPSLFPYLCDFSMLAIDLTYTNWTILGKGGNFPRFIFTIRCMICHDICTFSLKYGRNHCKITAFREKKWFILKSKHSFRFIPIL